MKLKLDDKGNVVLENGHPVYVTEDGKEIAFDVPKLVNDMQALRSENTGKRKDIENLTAQLKTFEGIEPEKAKRGLELLSLYDEGKLKDSAKLDELKATIEASYKGKFDDQEKRLGEEIAKLKGEIEAKDNAVRRMVIKGLFDASVFLKEKTVLPPDMAFATFGSMVEVEDVDGDLRAVGKINGQPIFSRKDPGKPATGDEIIEAIIDSYPMKDRILAGAPGGSGTPPNNARDGGSGGKTIKRSQFDAMNPTEKHSFVRGGGSVVDG